MTRRGLADLMRMLRGQYGHGRLGDDAEDSYRSLLASEGDAEMIAAAREFMRSDTQGFPPVAGQLLAVAKSDRRAASLARPTPDSLIAACVAHETRLAMQKGFPFVFVAMTGPAGNQLEAPEGGALMMAMRFTDSMRERYKSACTRGGEWVKSFTARGDIPPCIACYDDTLIRNCDLTQIRKCATAIGVPLRSKNENARKV